MGPSCKGRRRFWRFPHSLEIIYLPTETHQQWLSSFPWYLHELLADKWSLPRSFVTPSRILDSIVSSNAGLARPWSPLLDLLVLLSPALPPLRLPPLKGRRRASIGAWMCLKDDDLQVTTFVCYFNSVLYSCLWNGFCRIEVSWKYHWSANNNMLCHRS